MSLIKHFAQTIVTFNAESLRWSITVSSAELGQDKDRAAMILSDLLNADERAKLIKTYSRDEASTEKLAKDLDHKVDAMNREIVSLEEKVKQANRNTAYLLRAHAALTEYVANNEIKFKADGAPFRKNYNEILEILNEAKQGETFHYFCKLKHGYSGHIGTNGGKDLVYFVNADGTPCTAEQQTMPVMRTPLEVIEAREALELKRDEVKELQSQVIGLETFLTF